jgi:hypothetical protein
MYMPAWRFEPFGAIFFEFSKQNKKIDRWCTKMPEMQSAVSLSKQ